MIFVKYDAETLLPLEFISTNILDFLPKSIAMLDEYSDETFSELSEVYINDNLTAGVGADIATELAKKRATSFVRNAVASLLSHSDIKIKVLDEKLRIDRSNEDTIEAWFSLALARQQIRDSSNACQEQIANATSQFNAWDIAKSFSPTSYPLSAPAPEITKNAFLRRLSLTMSEKIDPVFQALTSDLMSLGYVDLRQASQTIEFLVSVGKLSRERADGILQSPIRWGERPIHGV